MFKILKNLKPYVHIILICVVLIFAQAMCDLKLPDLMSDIVNTGLTNKGVNSVLAEALSPDTYASLTLKGGGGIGSDILSDGEKDIIASAYLRSDRKTAESRVKYMTGASDGVYVRRDIIDKKDGIEDLEPELSAALQKGFVYLLSADTAKALLISQGFTDLYERIKNGTADAILEGLQNSDKQEDAMLLTGVGFVKGLTLTAIGAGLSQGDADALVGSFLSDLRDADLLALLNRADTVGAAPKYALFAPVSAAALGGIYGMFPADFSKEAALGQVVSELDKAGVDVKKMQSGYIWLSGLIMLGVALLSAVCTVTVGYFAAKVAARFARDVRKKLFKKVESFSNREIDKFTTASLITRSTNDISQIQQLLMFLIRMIFYAPMIGIGAIIYSVRKDPKFDLTWLNILAVGILVLMIAILFFIALPRFKRVQKLIDRLNLVTREQLSGMTVIRAFNKQKFESRRFDDVNRELTAQNLFINRMMIMLMPAMTLLMSGLSIAVIWIGADLIAENSMKVGDMMAFMQYAMQIVMAFLMIAVMFIMVPRASVAAKRITEVLETDAIIKDKENPQTFGGKKAKGILAFENVGFRYEGAEIDAVSGIDFTAAPGKVFAIIGTTGSGKSTLVNLMPRFYDVTSGRVTLDGVDIKDLSLKELRDNIGIVPQKSLLFSGTVATNLQLANAGISPDGMNKALSTAQIKDFIDSAEGGMEMNIAQGGQNVSGGQKQRLSIARALAKDAPVLVFDDSFSALDFKTDAKLRRALKLDLSDRTVIIVAQRIGTIKDADEILVLDEGKVAGKGKHAYLMESCGEYREIAFSQLNKEELL